MKSFAIWRSKLPGWWVLGDFLAWWVDELRATLASLLEVLRLRRSARLAVYIEGERLTIRPVGAAQELGSVTRNSEGRWPVAGAGGDSKSALPMLAGSAFIAVLPASDVLVKELVLPAAAEKRLDAVLAIQAVREFPLATTQLYVDHGLVRRVRDTKQIVVHLRAAKRAQIEEVSQWAKSVGGRLTRVCYRAGNGELSGNFLPRAPGAAIEHFTTSERRLAMGAVVLLLATAGIVCGQWWFERHHVNAELLKVRMHARQVRELWKEIEAQSAPANDLAKLMSTPDAATVLGGLPESVPMDSWVSQIEIRAPSTSPPTINLSAFAPAASRLVDELERTSHFEQVHLVYAGSDAFSNGGDRVQLSAEWVVSAQATSPLRAPPNSSQEPGRLP